MVNIFYMSIKDFFKEPNPTRDFFSLGLVLLEVELQITKQHFSLPRILNSILNLGLMKRQDFFNEFIKSKSAFLKTKTTVLPSDDPFQPKQSQSPDLHVSISVLDYLENAVMPYNKINKPLLMRFKEYRKKVKAEENGPTCMYKICTLKYSLKNLFNVPFWTRIQKMFAKDSHRCFINFVSYLRLNPFENMFIEMPPGKEDTRIDANREMYGKYLDLLINLVLDEDKTYISRVSNLESMIEEYTGDFGVEKGQKGDSDMSMNYVDPCDWKKYLYVPKVRLFKGVLERKPKKKSNKKILDTIPEESEEESMKQENDGQARVNLGSRPHIEAFPKSESEKRGQDEKDKERVRQMKKSLLRQFDKTKQRVTRILNNKRIKRQKNILLC